MMQRVYSPIQRTKTENVFYIGPIQVSTKYGSIVTSVVRNHINFVKKSLNIFQNYAANPTKKLKFNHINNLCKSYRIVKRNVRIRKQFIIIN